MGGAMDKRPLLHRVLVLLAFLLWFVCASACGGKIERSVASGSAGGADPNAVAAEPSAVVYPPEGAWGLWQLWSIPGPSGRDYEPPFDELDLHPDGIAYWWSCRPDPSTSDGNLPDGLPCPSIRRDGCVVGTIALSDNAWRVALTSNDARTVLGRGSVEPDASGDVLIDGSGILPAGARYHRVSAPSREACMP
jgi:hypothetical protein